MSRLGFIWLGGLFAGAAMAAAPTVQLDAGSIITVTIVEPAAEYDGFRQIVANDTRGMTLALKWTAGTGEAKELRKNQNVIRFVERQDLEGARKIRPFFAESDAESFPGATAVQTSRKVLEELKSKGESSLIFAYNRTLSDIGLPVVMQTAPYLRGTIKRLPDAPYPVILNGARVQLPVVRAAGRLALGQQSAVFQFTWLDDPANAMTLQWTGPSYNVQVVRIDTPAPAAETKSDALSSLARSLAAKPCRGEARGLYFNTGSAVLLEDSAPTLAELAALLGQHRDWTLTVEGHTDNQGGAAYNLDLSRQRATAVVSALVAKGIAAGRLKAQGFGLTRPKEGNDSVAGRAANRRVEIARDCGA